MGLCTCVQVPKENKGARFLGYWEMNSGPLENQHDLTEPSLQPLRSASLKGFQNHQLWPRYFRFAFLNQNSIQGQSGGLHPIIQIPNSGCCVLSVISVQTRARNPTKCPW